jgi:uncharacterized protein YwgA
MPEFNDASLILALTEKLRENQSWAGETHLQKAMYVLNRVLGVQIPFDFVLYKHGPFSFDLRDEIGWMRSSGFLEWEVRSNYYGPSLKPGQLSSILKKQFPDQPARHSNEIDFVATRFAGKNVASLERLTTAIYVMFDEHTPSIERTARIHSLKPHISIPEADAALREADGLVQAAKIRFGRAAHA